jgi:three-Cys-motif partner protein
LEWSRYKHQLLEKYLRVWCYKLGSFHRELAFVDTHGGAGKYDDGKDGSPLIAAKYNGDKAMMERGTGMTVHAFETEPEIARQLRGNLGPYLSQTPPRAFVYEESFFSNPAPVVNATRSVPTLFFVDPFKTVEVTADQLRPLLTDTHRASTEVLVRIDPTMLARFAGQMRKAVRNGATVDQAGGFARLLERLNIDTELIAEEAADDSFLPQDKYELLEQYLRLYTNRFAFVQVVPVRANYDAAPKYMIVHGTDSAHGAAHLNDIVSTLEDGLFTETYERRDLAMGQVGLFGPPQRPPSFSYSNLDAQALALIGRNPATQFIDVRAELARSFGPAFREKDHKASVKRLLKSGRIEVIGDATGLIPRTLLRVK